MVQKTPIQEMYEWLLAYEYEIHFDLILKCKELLEQDNKQRESLVNIDELSDSLTRVEVINHAKNDKPIGRILTLHQQLNDFDSVELSVQDSRRTLKIFLG